MKKIFCFLLILCAAWMNAYGQDVKNVSYTTVTGERILRFEMIIPIDKVTAWSYFTVPSSMVKWMAPQAKIELKMGGSILTSYDKDKPLRDDSTSINTGIINYLDYELLTLKVNLNNVFPEKTREEDQNLQEVVQFFDAGNGKTKIVSSMIGWGKGPDWDKAYNFFVEGNGWTYKEFLKLFK